VVFAIAGRRIDAIDTLRPAFPLEEVEKVKTQLLHLLTEHRAQAIVTSAACGADLIAIQVAEELDLHCHIVLPFDAAVFRNVSVTDRPGNWGDLFDLAIARAKADGALTILDLPFSDPAFAATSQIILEEAIRLGETYACPTAVILIWDRKFRPNDYTQLLGTLATERGIQVFEVLTV